MTKQKNQQISQQRVSGLDNDDLKAVNGGMSEEKKDTLKGAAVGYILGNGSVKDTVVGGIAGDFYGDHEHNKHKNYEKYH